jgi:hypothetical protein
VHDDCNNHVVLSTHVTACCSASALLSVPCCSAVAVICLQALADERVTNILLVGDYNIGKTREFDAVMGSPFHVNRWAGLS